MLKTLLLGAAALVLSSCAKDTPRDDTPTVAEPAAADAPGFEHNDYADMANWLCHPDKAPDACAIDLTATAIAADGSTQVLPFTAGRRTRVRLLLHLPDRLVRRHAQ